MATATAAAGVTAGTVGGVRAHVERAPARRVGARPGEGATVLVYHRIGGGNPDEPDVATADFTAQADLPAELPPGRVVPLDEALDRIEASRCTPGTVLTFDNGFADVYDNAWTLPRERGLPFTVYLVSGHVGGEMRWEGSIAKTSGAPGPSRGHARPEPLGTAEPDACNDDVEQHLGVRSRHYAYTWGVPVPPMEPALRARCRTAATGEVGRNTPGADPVRLCRMPVRPVRRTDPIDFLRAKLYGRLIPERAYARIVATAKAVGARA
ncbi:polysaccharide deacetylase family protein [Kitasatospora sp. NPDC127111]|uniref:polysaccharide deacetylase family protein n=1 Tax=Kitasatospora sp. NPDC127111 TaxID=3345363 RepID=UPI0036387058